ncbi:hypothetical protein FACS1894125_7230 [Actinomycetota bacterium]|nr:hypothetical protein FACS1894125_7230 [Actinomycetota bacterium]
MALLTADDIRYRKFAPTRFREGYDVDEVDDFLEEVIHTVDELTRLAQSSATNTGSFQALKPLVTDPETSPVFQDLQREKDGLAAQVKELEEKLKEAQNAPAPVISETGETQVSDEKTQQLYADNQELAQHLQNAETRTNPNDCKNFCPLTSTNARTAIPTTRFSPRKKYGAQLSLAKSEKATPGFWSGFPNCVAIYFETKSTATAVMKIITNVDFCQALLLITL